MKNYLLFILFAALSLPSFAQVTWQGGVNAETNTVNPTILFDKTGTPLAAYSGVIYAHTGLTVNGTPWQNVLGTWGNNTTQPALTLVSGNIYKLVLTPNILAFYSNSSGAITKVNIVLRNAAGSAQSVDLSLNVGAFQSVLVSPAENGTSILTSGSNLAISANNTNGNATYNLFANGVSISTGTAATFSYTDTNITSNKSYDLQINQGATGFSKKFFVIINPNTVTQALPSSTLLDGINYDSTDASKATLVLDAPGKDFVYVAGSFNNWQPDASYAMRKDAATGKFWLTLTGLTSGVDYSYQYWVVDTTPLAGSPGLVKTADPYSTLVLSPFDDPYIPAGNYPNMPVYPTGQEREVTILKTGQVPYNWLVTSFNKPKKEDLIVYEVLVRDFDGGRNFQDLINRIDYFKNLKVNAIELMPVMEFEGDEGWGYNPSFHMALDKFYGPADKMREFVDLCHQNGIAVILDVALNHAFGRNPMERMWMNDPDGDGWGIPSTENPYFNVTATHSYGVGNDFNHSQPRTKNYVKRVIKQWVEEFKIDGFRWDLTKGFTQNCTGDDACTNSYQQDRVDVLKEYADYSWSLDPTHYVIFEHLGVDSEEQQWANYRIAETPSKGVMMWSEMTYPYTQLIEGYTAGADISRMGNVAHGFTNKRTMGYPESHDKERMMYSAMTYGNAGGTAPPYNNLNNALGRMSAIGAASLLIPGPKMIWHFADLGCDDSIFTCTDTSINTDTDSTTGDCKLATKPQHQWTDNWLGVAERAKINTDWSKMIALKINEPVFEGNYAISPDVSNLKQRIYVYDTTLPVGTLRNVVVLCNFSVGTLSINPSFPYTGTWYNLMDNTPIVVTSTTATISIPPGQFLVYGNMPAALATDHFETMADVGLYPNPSQGFFNINTNTNKVDVFSIAGQLVKSFGKKSIGDSYEISDLERGVYMVKVTDENNREKTMKLIKQ